MEVEVYVGVRSMMYMGSLINIVSMNKWIRNIMNYQIMLMLYTPTGPWLIDNKLSLNTDKSELLNIPSNYSNFPQIFLNNNEITPITYIIYLGFIIDENVNMNLHSICKKSNYELYEIRKIRHYLNKRATTIITNSLVFSSLDYCNSLLIGLLKSTLIPINIIIRSAVRNIYR